MRKGIFFIFLMSMFICLAGCLDLGPLLFNPDDSITEYLWDQNPDNDYFDEEGNYQVPQEEFHYFTLESDHEGSKEILHALYLGDLEAISSDTVIVYCHGNSTHMDVYYPWVQMLYHAGEQSKYGVLMMDYRGFGLSSGVSTEASLLSDVDACLNWLSERGLTDDRLIMYGFSLGSIPAVYLTGNPRTLTPYKLMLEAPVGSIKTMSANASGLSMPASFFADLDTDNIEEIKKVKQDLYWIHGKADGFLNYTTHGEAIFNNHSGDYKVAHSVVFGDHHNVPFMFGEERYKESVDAFITK